MLMSCVTFGRFVGNTAKLPVLQRTCEYSSYFLIYRNFHFRLSGPVFLINKDTPGDRRRWFLLHRVPSLSCLIGDQEWCHSSHQGRRCQSRKNLIHGISLHWEWCSWWIILFRSFSNWILKSKTWEHNYFDLDLSSLKIWLISLLQLTVCGMAKFYQ